MTNTNVDPSIVGRRPAPVQPTQLDWLGNLSNLLVAAEDCFVANSASVYHENLRKWNTSNGATDGGSASDPNPYPERGPHKLPGVCSLKWHDGGWYMHLLPEDFSEVIEGLFADGRLNVTQQSGAANGFEVYLAGDFTVRRYIDDCYELSYTPVTMSSIRLFTLAEQEDLGNVRGALERCGIHLKWEE